MSIQERLFWIFFCFGGCERFLFWDVFFFVVEIGFLYLKYENRVLQFGIWDERRNNKYGKNLEWRDYDE